MPVAMISMMDKDCDLDKGSDVVAAALPFFWVESSEDDKLNEQHIHGLNGISDGSITMSTGSEEVRVYTEVDSEDLKSGTEVRVSEEVLPDLDSSGRNDDCAVGIAEAEKRESPRARVSSEIDSKEGNGDMEPLVSDVKADVVPVSESSDGFSIQNSGVKDLMSKADGEAMVSSGETKWSAVMMNEQAAAEFNSQYSMFNAGQMPEALGAETLRALGCEFEIGDMVWGKVKSHPWWPGHIFNEAFASSSVRRTRREGHVLVAFFGDSSYGWFDPSELVPFDPHFAEKSRQTSSRNFIKAVEEAVDEASRRSAIGLTCRCHSPFNFRPTAVQGYFAVDVGGYEPGGIYSVKQIKKARDSFQPVEALSFVQQMALMPRNGDRQSIGWIKNIAMIYAYRKAIFEEFDETYAQAFGVQPVRPSREKMYWEQYTKLPSRAPLSGPMVIAETLGERKSSTKPVKVKDQSKKDKYLFKRRDEPSAPRVHHHIDQGQSSFIAPSTYKEGSAALAAGDYVLQKRPPAAPMKPQIPRKQEGTVSRREGSALTQGLVGKEAMSVDKKSVVTNSSSVDTQVIMNQNHSLSRFSAGFSMTQPPVNTEIFVRQAFGDAKAHMNEDIGAGQDMKGQMGSDAAGVPHISGVYGSDLLGRLESPGIVDGLNQAFQREGEAMVDSKHEESAKLLNTSEGLQQPKPRQLITVGDRDRPDKVLEDGSGTPSLPINVNFSGKVLEASIDGVVKKAKVLKHPKENLSSGKTSFGEKNKKKKKEFGSDKSLHPPQKRLKTGKDEESVRKSLGKPIGTGLVSKEISQVDQQRKENGTSSSFPPDSVMTSPVVDMGNIEVELAQLVGDLLALALDPFHGLEWNSPAIVRQVFLRFRSLVYQKSLILSPPPAEAECSEAFPSIYPASSGAAEILPHEDVKYLPIAPKPQKQLLRPDDPTKSGRKRSLSDRQEEMSAKRLKKMTELKSLAAEKKAGGLKSLDAQRGEQKETGVVTPTKHTKPDSIKKAELPPRVAEPAMLVMKFPPRTSLPSVPELKARFARFGPLDHSATRVFWKSSTCRIVFKHKSHAQAAHNYSVRNNNLFGNVKVKYQLRDLENPAGELPESSKQDNPDEGPQLLRSQGGVSSDFACEARPAPFHRRTPQSSVQLKSCLKKPSGDESAAAAGMMSTGMIPPREGPRVKFMLSGDESSRGNADGVVGASSSSSSSSHATMDVMNSKNFEKVNPQLPPLLPLPPFIPDVHENHHGVVGHHFSKAHHHHMHHYSEVETRTNNNIDISHQMISLMMRCSDIVADVKCSLGYVPYHPL